MTRVFRGASVAMPQEVTESFRDGVSPASTYLGGISVYDPVHACFLLVNVLDVGAGGVGGTTDGVFAFRYDRAAASKR